MIEQEVKDKVRAVLRLMKPEWMWAGCDASGDWWAYDIKPTPVLQADWWDNVGDICPMRMEILPPFPGDWRDSLVEREE